MAVPALSFVLNIRSMSLYGSVGLSVICVAVVYLSEIAQIAN